MKESFLGLVKGEDGEGGKEWGSDQAQDRTRTGDIAFRIQIQFQITRSHV